MRYRAEIDGLRAIAVIPVILFHAGFSAFGGGFIGVDVFFVISGYLITSIILSEMEGEKFSLINFYERRARRILPALFFVMAVCIPFAWIWFMPLDMKEFWESLVAISFFSSNILFWQDTGYFATEAELKPLLHTWSLAVEEQYYILFPPFLFLVWRFKRSWVLATLVLAGVVSLGISHWAAYNKPGAGFFLLPTRGWEILMGSLVAVYFNRNDGNQLSAITNQVFSFVGLMLIFYSIVFFSSQTPFPSLYALVPTVGAALIILCATEETIVQRLLGSRMLVGIGLISYSAYLWHQPLFAFTRQWSVVEPTKLLMALLISIAFFLSYFSWRFVEKPFRNKNTIGRTAIFSSSIVGIIVFSLVGIGGAFDYFPSNYSVDTYQVKESQLRTERPCNRREIDIPIRKYCKIIGRDNEPTMVLLGDSHAGSLAYALEEELLRRGKSAYIFTLGGCPPVNKVALSTPAIYENCLGLNKFISEEFLYGDNNPNIRTVVLFSRWTAHWRVEPFNNMEGGVERRLFTGSESAILSGLVNDRVVTNKDVISKLYLESLNRISRLRDLVLIYPVPEAGWNVPRLLQKYRIREMNVTSEVGSTSYKVFQERHAPIHELFEKIANPVVRVRPELLLCNKELAGRCITHTDGVPLYYDDDHLSDVGARLVVDELFKNIGNVVGTKVLKANYL